MQDKTSLRPLSWWVPSPRIICCETTVGPEQGREGCWALLEFGAPVTHGPTTGLLTCQLSRKLPSPQQPVVGGLADGEAESAFPFTQPGSRASSHLGVWAHTNPVALGAVPCLLCDLAWPGKSLHPTESLSSSVE